jgi:hypothetical protein
VPDSTTTAAASTDGAAAAITDLTDMTAAGAAALEAAFPNGIPDSTDATSIAAAVLAGALVALSEAGNHNAGNNAAVFGTATAPAAQERAVLDHDREGLTAYRFAAPGLLVAGEARVTVQGDWWHAEQELADGTTIAVDAEDELGAILALIGKQRGLAVVIGPDDGQAPPAPMTDSAAAVAFNSVTHAVARRGRFLALGDRAAVAEQVLADLRAQGWLA